MARSEISPDKATQDGTLTHEIRVGWADCDPAHIAYTGRIPWFALESIDCWWEHYLGHGWYQIKHDLGMGTPFVHLSVDFRSPVTPRHRLICKARPTRLGKTSIGFEVKGYQNDVLCFEGRFVSVFVMDATFSKIPAPEEIENIVRPMLNPDTQQTLDGN